MPTDTDLRALSIQQLLDRGYLVYCPICLHFSKEPIEVCPNHKRDMCWIDEGQYCTVRDNPREIVPVEPEPEPVRVFKPKRVAPDGMRWCPDHNKGQGAFLPIREFSPKSSYCHDCNNVRNRAYYHKRNNGWKRKAMEVRG
jgi:hypothetical protein